jgi:membrane protease YdiL (CAAX protease family)
MGTIIEAVLIGMLVMLAGTVPWDIVIIGNFRFLPSVPWALPVIGVYMFFYWRYLSGWGEPQSTAATRRERHRANPLPVRTWMWALIAGGLGIVALVLALKLANRMVLLPKQEVPDLSHMPVVTIVVLLITSSAVAGLVEESAFRGYMQGPIEKRYGPLIAILINGTMFGIAHLDFTLMLWPYYVAVAAIYGMVVYLTNSILPAVVLHMSGNLYSNYDLWVNGRAEWQAAKDASELVWSTGADTSFWTTLGALAVALALCVGAYFKLARVARIANPAAL